MVTALHDGRRRIVAATDTAARALGLHPGMPLSHAQAMVPGLAVSEADPPSDAAALARLAAWCLRYAPLTCAAPPDGLLLDATGCAHLFGGEAVMLAEIVRQLSRIASGVRAAIADTPGAAHAVARHAAPPVSVVPEGQLDAALRPLPIAALRLPEAMLQALHRLGFERIGALADAPRAPLARRFGPMLLLRLDQAFGRVAEPIVPVVPPEIIQHRIPFAEPLLTAEAFAGVNVRLVAAVCAMLERAGQGGRRFDLACERVDASVQMIRVGTARATRDARHLLRLLNERIEQVDPGLGVDAVRLAVPWAEPLAYSQAACVLGGAAAEEPSVAELIDRLQNRLGAGRVWRAAPVESDVPERSVRHVEPLAQAIGATWSAALPRPTRIIEPPQPIEAMALLPDQPPVAFTWRRHRHRVRRADGPERIHGEWWRREGEVFGVRDYFRVEDEAGRRFWLFRRGDGADSATGDLRWFLHGIF